MRSIKIVDAPLASRLFPNTKFVKMLKKINYPDGQVAESENSSKEILNSKEAANYLFISLFQLYRLSRMGLIPSYSPTGGKIYFMRSELEDWVRAGRRATVKDIKNKATKSITLSIVK